VVVKAAATSGQEGVLNVLNVFTKHLDVLPFIEKWSLVARFYNAAKVGKQAIIQELLDQSVQPDLQNPWRVSPIWIASSNGHLEVVRLLLGTKAVDVNVRSVSGRSPIIWAAIRGWKEIVTLLLEAEAIANKCAKITYLRGLA
jgi:ankyrin repeat protein